MCGWFSRKKADPDKLRSEAVSLVDSGDYKGAIKKFSDYIKLKPGNFDAYAMRGQAYLKLERFDDAIEDFSKALKLNPNDSNMLYFRGQAYSLRGESEKAVEDYKLTLEKSRLSPGFSPNKYSVHLSLGAELSKLGRYKEAKVHLEEVLAVSPNNEIAQTIIRKIHQKNGE